MTFVQIIDLVCFVALRFGMRSCHTFSVQTCDSLLWRHSRPWHLQESEMKNYKFSSLLVIYRSFQMKLSAWHKSTSDVFSFKSQTMNNSRSAHLSTSDFTFRRFLANLEPWIWVDQIFEVLFILTNSKFNRLYLAVTSWSKILKIDKKVVPEMPRE